MGTALSTTGNKHHTLCPIGVAILPLSPNAPHLVMGSSAEVNEGWCARKRRRVFVQQWRPLHIHTHMRMCALVYVCVRGRANVCVCVCVYLRGLVVGVCVTSKSV